MDQQMALGRPDGHTDAGRPPLEDAVIPQPADIADAIRVVARA